MLPRSAAHAANEPVAFAATDCATDGVIAAQGSRDGLPGTHLLTGEAVHALAAGVADIEHVGDLCAVLFLGGQDVGPQMEVSALVVASSHGDALALECGGELLMQLLAERVGRTDDGIQHHLGDRRFGHRLGRRGRLLRGVVAPRSRTTSHRRSRQDPRPANPTTASATNKCWRRAAAASVVVTVTPYSRSPLNPQLSTYYLPAPVIRQHLPQQTPFP